MLPRTPQNRTVKSGLPKADPAYATALPKIWGMKITQKPHRRASPRFGGFLEMFGSNPALTP
jgi:hypothetical protein